MSDATEKVRATMLRLGLGATDLAPLGQTMRARARTPIAMRPLPSLSLASESDVAAEFVKRAELGRGGMGVVHLASQRSLDRDVAVKTVMSADPMRVAALMREALVMGRLEHPSIVPVHALGIDEGGAPVLVMKRVEGTSWASLLRDESHPSWKRLLAGHGDRLRVHVEILVQLCHALSFAHSRGFVHRDLKPENVMVGAFGEVLLLDWGLGLRLDERFSEPPGIVGTPGYLAPEMAMGDPNEIDERTDVYLLGANLYELLTGHMPHRAETALGALASSLAGEITPPPPSAPRELAELAMQALGPRHERPASVEAFRERLARFLTSRETDGLVVAARDSLERARDAAQRHGAGSPEALSPLVEARFALTTARAMRPGDLTIEAALDACLLSHAEREIALRSASGARALLPELREPPRDLIVRIEALERELEAERRDAERARDALKQADLSVARTAFSTLLLVTLGLAIAYLTGGLGAPASSPTGQVTWQLLTFSASALILFAERRRMTTDRARRTAAFLLIWFSYGLAHALIRLVRGEPTMDWGTALVSGTLLAATGALFAWRRLWATVPVHAIACAYAVVRPEDQDLAFNVMFWVNAVIVVWAAAPEVFNRTPEGSRDRAAHSRESS